MGKSLDIIDVKKDLRTPEQDEPEDILDRGPSSGRGGAFYLVLGIIALVVAISVALYVLYKDSNLASTADKSQTATNTQAAVVTTTTIATATPTITLTAPSSVSGSTTFKYTDESIRIANGNSINGEANKIKKVLEDAGFKVASVGNASRSYAESTIYYKTDQENLAKALQSAIKENYTATIKQDDQVVGTYDAIVVLGSK